MLWMSENETYINVHIPLLKGSQEYKCAYSSEG